MMDEDKFQEVAQKYFDHAGLTDLHTALCLLAKVNPANREVVVGEETEEMDPKDGASRFYKYALEAIQFSRGHSGGTGNVEPLMGFDTDPSQKNAKRYRVNLREFVKWSVERWPHLSDHLQTAEEAYQNRKKAKKTLPTISGNERWKIARKEFFAFLSEGGLDPSKSKGRVLEWSKMLSDRLGKIMENPLGHESIRKRMPEWIEDHQTEKENT